MKFTIPPAISNRMWSLTSPVSRWKKLARIASHVMRRKRSAEARRVEVSVGYIDSYVGEGQISYAGPGALERGRLAIEIVQERLSLCGVETSELRCDLIGSNALHGENLSLGCQPYEVRVRVIGRTETLAEARRIGEEVETLYTNGPAGGGRAWKSAREVIAVASTLIPEADVRTAVQYFEA